jgi:hypothetical protein
MKKNFLLFITSMILFTTNMKAQKEIRDGIYLYGNAQNTIHGNILVAYKIDDPESEAIILDKLEDAGLPIFSYHDFFFPHVEYEVSEIDSFIKSRNIETILYVTLKSVGSHTQTTFNSFYSELLKTNFTFGKSQKVVDDVTLVFEIHNQSDGFKRPVAVLQGTGTNLWGSFGSFQSTLYKTVKNIVKALDDEGAFGGEKKEHGIDGMQEYINRRK